MGCELSRSYNSASPVEKENDSKPGKKKRPKNDCESQLKGGVQTTLSVSNSSNDKRRASKNSLPVSEENKDHIPALDPEWISAHELTNEQKDLIEESWKVLVDSIAEVGVIVFMRLFETHPDVQQAFLPFKELSDEELHFSRELRAHALRVMGFVQKVVARLREPKEKTESLLRALGANHVTYGAKEQYVDLIGPQFVFAIKPSLEAQWSPDMEEAWLQLFRYISDVMKESMAITRRRNSTKPDHQDSTDINVKIGT